MAAHIATEPGWPFPKRPDENFGSDSWLPQHRSQLNSLAFLSPDPVHDPVPGGRRCFPRAPAPRRRARRGRRTLRAEHERSVFTLWRKGLRNAVWLLTLPFVPDRWSGFDEGDARWTRAADRHVRRFRLVRAFLSVCLRLASQFGNPRSRLLTSATMIGLRQYAFLDLPGRITRVGESG